MYTMSLHRLYTMLLLTRWSPLLFLPASYNFPRPKGKHRSFAGDNKRGVQRKCRHRHALIRVRSVLCQPKLLLRIRPCLWHGRTSSTADAVPLPLEGKALTRSTSAQHNTDNVRRDSDHRNPFSRQHPPKAWAHLIHS